MDRGRNVGAQEDLDAVRLEESPDDEGFGLVADPEELLELALVPRLGRS
jgi:hypothetical protein